MGIVQDVALVCLNGHLVNGESRRSPQLNTKHCEKCGAPTIDKCPACNDIIRGDQHYEHVIGGGMTKPPKYCHNCGKAYPWTSEKIEAAKELVGMSKFDDKTKGEIIDAIVISTTDTARTSVGAERLKKYWPAIGQTIQGVVTDILSETAKKILFGK